MQQFQQFKNLSSWRDKDYTIKGGEVVTIDFIDTEPNQFVIQNSNNAVLYVSIANIPTVNKYEFKVDKNSYGLVGRPTSTKKLYVLNGSSEDATIKVFSVYDKFDMNILKQMSASFGDMAISTDGIVRGFQGGVSLPSGNNHIGKVTLDDVTTSIINTIKTDTDSIDATLSAMKTTLTTNKDNTSEIISILNNLEVGGSGGTSTDARMYYINGDCYDKIPVYHNGVTSVSYTATSDCTIYFNYLLNDGSDVTVNINASDVLTVMSGEQITDITFKLSSGDTLDITGTSASIRAKYYVF